MYRVYFLTVKDNDDHDVIYESAGLTEKTFHKLVTDFCEESNCPNWTIEITSTDYEEKPWWLREV